MLHSADGVGFFGGHLIHNLYRRSYFLSNRLQNERERSEKLLSNILPTPIADELKTGNNLIAEGYDEITVLFADIVNFTPLADELKPTTVVILLDDIFSSFDQIVDDYPVEKFKTIGDEYFLVSGVPNQVEGNAYIAAKLAIELRKKVKKYNRPYSSSFNVRIGLNTGPAVAGVIGMNKFVYDVWGDTVNVGSRMESKSKPGKIQITRQTKESIQSFDNNNEFQFKKRNNIPVKGKGKLILIFYP